MSVSQVLKTHTSKELAELMAYERLYGSIGDERLDVLFGMLTSVIGNVHRDSKRHPDPFVPLDFMPYHEEERQQMKINQRRRRSEALKMGK